MQQHLTRALQKRGAVFFSKLIFVAQPRKFPRLQSQEVGCLPNMSHGQTLRDLRSTHVVAIFVQECLDLKKMPGLVPPKSEAKSLLFTRMVEAATPTKLRED